MNPESGDRGVGQELEGRYANYFEIGHNAVEFLLDFGQFYAEHDAPRVHTRIVTNPVYAKALLETLRDAVERYEAAFGSIGDE